MDQFMRPEVLAASSFPRPVSRSHSTVSEKPTFSKTILSPPPPATPDPAYISPSAASQWVSAELDDDELSVSSGALSLLNSFLDQMLFSFLSSARSTRLPQLRQAVPEVLKPRLGKDAMANADEELREYLGDGDDEELSDFYDGHEPARDFDLELAWKLARLRCMVYTRLGDLEEEDALEIMAREHLDERGGQPRRFSGRSNSITPAGAIFLTSIIEYLGEQALYHAGMLAQTRAFNAHPPPQEDSAETGPPHSRAPKSTIEEIDVRRLGREGPLARIWRSWRRPTRSPQESFSRPISPSEDEEVASLSESSTPRSGTVGSLPLPNIAQTIHSTDPAHIPLPMSGNDVNEIEVPGLAREIDDEEVARATENPGEETAKRPNSMVFLPHEAGKPLTPVSNYTPSNMSQGSPLRPQFGRQRSQSVPTPPQSPLKPPKGPPTNTASVAPTGPNNVDDEAAKAKPAESVVSARDAVTQDKQTSTRDGLAINAMSALADTQGPRPTVGDGHSERNESQPVAAVRDTGVDTTLPSSAVPDQVPQSAVTTASIHGATDFNGIHLPERQQTSVRAPVETASDEIDPEDLALSSADDEPEPTQRRSKHDSIPPVQMGSSSYTYSTSPGDAFTPTPQHSDFPEVPSTHQSVPVVPPSLIGRPHSSAKQEATPSPNLNLESTTKSQNDVTQELPNQLAQKAPTEAPRTAASGSLPQPRLGSNAGSELSQQSSDSTSSSKLLGYIRDDQGRPLPATEPGDPDVHRAAPTGSSRVSNDTWHAAATNSGGAPDMRPGTAGSQQAATKRPLKLRMSSEEKEAVWRSSFESEAKKRSLELLIQGDETLHYTLTPTSARPSEYPESIRQVMAPTQDSGDYGRNAASSHQSPAQHKAQHSVGSIRSAKGLRAHPLHEEYAPQTPVATSAAPATSPPRATSRPGSSSSKLRHGQPRDAKVEASTSRDLADYLRSTGPESDSQLPRALVSRPAAPASQPPPPPPSPTARSATQPSQSGEPSRSKTHVGGQAPLQSSYSTATGRRPPTTTTTTTTTTSRSSGAPRHQPRDAQISRNATTSALADFIREGPPRAAGDHRIPRTVAPFRNTMDSDDLNGLLSSADKDRPGRSLTGSTQDSSTVSQSVQSSANSHTALLDRSKKGKPGSATNGTRSGTSIVSSPSLSTAQDGRPKRKQRRVRDPYAIDDSDDDIQEVATPKPKRDEESLIDFLRNTAPQPSMTAQPIVAKPAAAAPKQGLQKKTSSSAIRDRIRNTNIPGLSRKNSASATDPPAYSRGSAARAESPHLSQAGSKLDSYKPTKPTHAAHVDRLRSSRVNGASSMSAEYLPHAEQSRATRTTTTTTTTTQDESGFRAFFSRRKSVKQ